jgi:hypothetical protein
MHVRNAARPLRFARSLRLLLSALACTLVLAGWGSVAFARVSAVIDADVDVRESNPDKNYGTSSTLSIDARSAKHTFFRVVVSGIGSRTVLGASLALQVDAASSAASESGGRIHAISDCT